MKDESPNLPPKQFRPNPGQMGQAAALHRPPGRPSSGQGKEGRSRQSAKPEPRSERKDLGVPEAPPEAPPDLRHLTIGLHHQNAVELGRTMPIGLWILRNGLLAQVGRPGVQSYDLFYD